MLIRPPTCVDATYTPLGCADKSIDVLVRVMGCVCKSFPVIENSITLSLAVKDAAR